MPIYEYSCQSCHDEFEHRQGIKDSRLKHCIKCGEDTLVRHIGYGGHINMNPDYKDSVGTPIWYPNNNDKPYYDKALNRVFNNRAEKKTYMNEKRIVMDGSSDHPKRNRIPEAGTTRTNVPLRIFNPK